MKEKKNKNWKENYTGFFIHSCGLKELGILQFKFYGKDCRLFSNLVKGFKLLSWIWSVYWGYGYLKWI